MAASPLPSCDTIVVLGPHTRAGATILAKNSDRAPYECQPLAQSPHRVHPEGATVHCQYLEIPQVAETAAVPEACTNPDTGPSVLNLTSASMATPVNCGTE